MGRNMMVFAVMGAVLVLGCAEDVTSTEEYSLLAQQQAVTETALFEAEAQVQQIAQELATVRENLDITSEVRAVQEEWFAAWNATDGNAVVSMMAPGGRHYCPGTGKDGAGGDELAAFVNEGWQMADAEIVSAVRTQIPGESRKVYDDYVVATEFTLKGHPGYLSVLHLRGRQGEPLLVLDHRVYP